jgi:hypothetical protein
MHRVAPAVVLELPESASHAEPRGLQTNALGQKTSLPRMVISSVATGKGSAEIPLCTGYKPTCACLKRALLVTFISYSGDLIYLSGRIHGENKVGLLWGDGFATTRVGLQEDAGGA